LGLAICEKLISMMDGDISVASEPGMGSQFTVRIPLYQAQYASATNIDGIADKRCWLNVRNDSLGCYLMTLLTQSGLRTQYWAGETLDSDDILLTDEEGDIHWSGKAVITFSRTHIGFPIERSAGHWACSTVSPHEVLALLGRIYRVNIELPGTAQTLPVMQEISEENGDMMILVVDDHPINRRLLADQLSLLGYVCMTANDGVDALNVLSSNHIDIVLSDVNMPNMDGYRLTQRIRELGLTIPVVGVTANALAEEKQRCIESGMDSCLSKPVTLDVVKQTLATYSRIVRNGRKKESETTRR